MPRPYEHKPFKEPTPIIHHCKSCKHFMWGLITPYTDYDGVCMFNRDVAKRKSHQQEACANWERK